MDLFIRPQIPHTLISSADLKCCTPNLYMTPPKTDILKNILCLSVCLSNAGFMSKRMDTSLQFLTLWQVHHSNFIGPICSYKISREPGKGSLETFFITADGIFLANMALYLGKGTRSAHARNTNRKSCVADRSVGTRNRDYRTKICRRHELKSSKPNFIGCCRIGWRPLIPESCLFCCEFRRSVAESLQPVSDR